MTSITKLFDEKIKDEHIDYFEYSEFSEIVEIGRGSFGNVSKAKLASTGLVALKSLLDENSNIEEDELNKLIKEVRIVFCYVVQYTRLIYKIKLIYLVKTPL
jgi:hypothetical protein